MMSEALSSSPVLWWSHFQNSHSFTFFPALSFVKCESATDGLPRLASQWNLFIEEARDSLKYLQTRRGHHHLFLWQRASSDVSGMLVLNKMLLQHRPSCVFIGRRMCVPYIFGLVSFQREKYSLCHMFAAHVIISPLHPSHFKYFAIHITAGWNLPLESRST